MKITTPSGLAGEVRKLKGSEANILADRKAARKGETYDKILRACWMGTSDVGPYEEVGAKVGEASVPWGKILVCDRFYALVAMRIATYGSGYIFPVRCGEVGRGCGHRFEWEVNLETELPLYDLPEDSRLKIACGENRFETELEGTPIVFKLQTGEDERRVGRTLHKQKGELFTAALAARTVEIAGIEKHEIQKFYDDHDLGSQLELLGKFEEVDGGFETQFEVECPDCDNVFEVAIPFEGEAFWLPRSRTKRKSRPSKGRTPRTMAGAEEP